MKKLEKIFWSVVLILVVLTIIGAIVASVFLGDIVKKGVETVGPQITRVSVKLDEVHLTLLTGSASVKGLLVGNPEGYQPPQPISAGLISAIESNAGSANKIAVNIAAATPLNMAVQGQIRMTAIARNSISWFQFRGL